MFQKVRFSAVVLLAVSTGAFAASDGFYVGGDFGVSNTAYSHSDFNYMTDAHVDKTGVAGGAFFGYQMSPMLAAELGYTRPARVNLDNITMASNTPGGLTTLSNGSITMNIWDFAIKGMVPLKNGFGLNAKVGAAYVKYNVGGGLDQSNLGSMYKDNSKVLPEAGLGASYDFNKNVTTGVNFKHIFKGGNIENIDLATVDLGYHFG